MWGYALCEYNHPIQLVTFHIGVAMSHGCPYFDKHSVVVMVRRVNEQSTVHSSHWAKFGRVVLKPCIKVRIGTQSSVWLLYFTSRQDECEVGKSKFRGILVGCKVVQCSLKLHAHLNMPFSVASLLSLYLLTQSLLRTGFAHGSQVWHTSMNKEGLS